MNAPTLPANLLTATLERFRDADMQERREAYRAIDKELCRVLNTYIDHPSIGGVVNLLTTIATICEERSQLEGDDWEKAAIAINDCSDECDLKYSANDIPDGDSYEQRKIDEELDDPRHGQAAGINAANRVGRVA